MTPFGPLTSAVRRARVGRDEQRDVVVAVVELHFEPDSLEERRVGTEEEPVDTGSKVRGQFRDASVVVGLARCEEIVLPDLDAHTARGPAAFDVEDMCGEGDAHAANLCAWRRCSHAISSSSPRASLPSRTTSSPPT